MATSQQTQEWSKKDIKTVLDFLETPGTRVRAIRQLTALQEQGKTVPQDITNKVMILSMNGGKNVRNVVSEFSQGLNPENRDEALMHPDFEAAAIEAIASRNWQGQQVAVAAVQGLHRFVNERSPAAQAAVLTLLIDGDTSNGNSSYAQDSEDAQRAALQFAKKLSPANKKQAFGHPDFEKFALKQLTSIEWKARQTAVQGLNPFAKELSPAVQAAIMNLSKDVDKDVRNAVSGFMEKLNPKDEGQALFNKVLPVDKVKGFFKKFDAAAIGLLMVTQSLLPRPAANASTAQARPVGANQGVVAFPKSPVPSAEKAVVYGRPV